MGRSAPEKAGMSRKQFMLLNNSPILIHTIRKFVSSPSVTEIVVALREDDLTWAEELFEDQGIQQSRSRRSGRGNAPAIGRKCACHYRA